MIRLQTLGSPEIRTLALTITPSQEIVFAATLYLLLESERPVSRTRLAGLLWPNAVPNVRSHRLRQTLLQVKRIGVDLTVTRDTVRISPGSFAIDTAVGIPSREGSAIWPAHLEILTGYDPSFSEPFSEWVELVRERIKVKLLERLIPALENARSSGDWVYANCLASYCLDLDSFNESALLARAEAFAMRGQKKTALDLLDRYIEEVTPRNAQLAIPAKILRNRVSKYAPPIARVLADEPAWVGRREEMLFLTDQLAKVRSGLGAACLIKGEPGIGKTRLTSELAKFAVLQGVRVERVSCRKSESDQPLAAFVTLVPKLRELPGALGADQESLIALRRLTDINPGGYLNHNPGEDAGSAYANLRSAILDLLDAVLEERPLLIIVDDIQWLDATSANFFAAMVEALSTKRLFLVFTTRASATIEDYVARALLPKLHLQPLDASDVQAVIVDIVARLKTEISPAEIDWLARTSDGNPYFLLELTKQWIETGASNAVPPSVVDVLGERISRLSPAGTRLLQACAVLGENANIDRLDQVLELPAHQTMDALEELTGAGMLRAGMSIDGKQQTLQVRHDLLASAALAHLNPVSSAFLHRRCGLVLEREVLGDSISASLLWACAFHWQEAGDATRAYELSMKCAGYLLEIGLAGDASAALEGVLAFCANSEQQIQVLLRIVEAHRLARDSAALLATIARVRALQNADRDGDCHDDLEITELEARRISEPAVGPVLSRTLVCVYNSQLSAVHRVRVAVVALKLATAVADLAEIEKVYLMVKDSLSDSAIDLRSRLQVQVIYHTMVGDLGQAVRFAKERVALERESGSALQLSNAITDLAFVLRRAGPQEEVPAALNEAYEIAKSRKLFAAAREYAVRLAEFLLESDQTERSSVEIWLARAEESHGEPDQLQTACSATAAKARLALWDKRLLDAERLVDAFPWNELGDRHSWQAAGVALRLNTYIAQGRSPDSVLPYVNELRTLYERISQVGGQDYEVSALCRGLSYVNDDANARWHLTDYISKKRREATSFSRELREASSLTANTPGADIHEKELELVTV